MAEGAGHAVEREGGGVGLRSFVLSSGRVGGFDLTGAIIVGRTALKPRLHSHYLSIRGFPC